MRRLFGGIADLITFSELDSRRAARRSLADPPVAGALRVILLGNARRPGAEEFSA